jgi:hypothetical protein
MTGKQESGKRKKLHKRLVYVVLFVVLFSGLAVAGFRFSYSFLAITDRKDCDILIVEGWMPDFALQVALEEYKQNNYNIVITSGADIQMGSYLSAYKSFAELARASLVSMGMDSQKVVAVPAGKVERNRTYSSALAVKEYLSGIFAPVTAVNVFTLGPHGRRTRLLFEKAFGGTTSVGIISATDHNYDPDGWWHTSVGFRTMMSELLAYVYARFVFKAS